MNKKFIYILKSILITVFLFAYTGVAGIGVLRAEAAGYGSAVTACVIQPGGSITVLLNTTEIPQSDDGIFYLFESPTYGTSITGSYISTAPIASAAAFTFPLNAGQADSRLYSKFAAAVLQGGQLVQVSEAGYITNPEAIAASTAARTVTASKKGLLVDPAKLKGTELTDLGVKHAAYNISVSNILGKTTNNSYPTIQYQYNGKTYPFNGLVVAEYDHVFKALSDKGISVTAVLLNNFTGAYPQLLHPYARDGSAANYYAFNAAEAVGPNIMRQSDPFWDRGIPIKDMEKWTIGLSEMK